MATLLLQAAGAYLGGLFGTVGATIGTAAGALGGYLVDRALINGSQHIKGARLSQMQPLSGEDGAPLARVYGTMRLGGTVIWATRFEESANTERQGAKGGPRVTTYRYYANFAVAICEGEIAHVRRIWADGRELDRTDFDIRIHKGSESQLPDPLIEAKQGAGNAPAFRGTAYAVFDCFPLENFGNRIPQLQFEVIRMLGGIEKDIKAITIIPGSTEFGLAPEAVSTIFRRGETILPNRHTLVAESDWAASLDELQALCPNLESVSLVVAWFGDDLRAGECKIKPGVTTASLFEGVQWWAGGVTRFGARLVSDHEGRKAYGGTPDDASVIAAIQDLKARGLKVTLYPFVLMDVPAGNTLPSPYGGLVQPAYPWRGEISCHPAPGMPGSVDVTASVASQVAAFVGTAVSADLIVFSGKIFFNGGTDWGYRRFILHYAKLAQIAGGVDGFLIGSEFKGLTRVRSAAGVYPFVAALQAIAGDVRAVLGSGTRITYAADWTEYGAYVPPASSTVDFPLDPLWAHPDIDAIGIDNYMPLSDWRDVHADGSNPDGAASSAELDALVEGVGSGEAYDWYYSSLNDREAGLRTPITDGVASKPWVFRQKDLRGWWENQHFARAGGTESPAPTVWVPRSKPIWFTELGCPAVDKGANQPNVFPDAKSSSAALPWFSDGGRDDLIQNRFLRAHQTYWAMPENNPLSPAYDGPMVDMDNCAVWTWDARPFPVFPLDSDVWGDGDNWLTGHWLNGRLSGVPLDGLTKSILAEHGVEDVDCSQVEGFVSGYVLNGQTTAREALDELLRLYRVDVSEDGARAVLRSQRIASSVVEVEDPVVGPKDSRKSTVRSDNSEVPKELTLMFRDELRDFQQSSVLSRISKGEVRSATIELPAVIDTAVAESELRQLHRQMATAQEKITFRAGWGDGTLMPGDIVRPFEGASQNWRVCKITDGESREIEAESFVAGGKAAVRSVLPGATSSQPAMIGVPWSAFLDLPSLPQSPAMTGLRIAAWSKPWTPMIAFSSPGAEGYAERLLLPRAVVAGILASPLASGKPGRWDRSGAIEVQLFSGSLAAAAELLVLGGANVAAVQSVNGQWEIIQFTSATETSPGTWQLTGLLRGQLGTEDVAQLGAASGSEFVLLDNAVLSAGLTEEESGLTLNWKTGPQGKDFTDRYFDTVVAGPAKRYAKSYAPAHLRGRKMANGDLSVSWVRRSKLDGDSWDAADVPLPEGQESFRVRVLDDTGALKREMVTTSPQWIYADTQQVTDFGPGSHSVKIEVCQIGSDGLAGIAATFETNLG